MLEPERTGVRKNSDRRPSWVLIAVLMLLLASGAALAVILAMR